ncbi:hypothetical protein, partial [Klebsiella quasipneumoniae]|uniref:hypothetical protein n=1 Tax=Klebsiella quasipneumoniae TaxID=1463165 RepID=UPI001CFBA677
FRERLSDFEAASTGSFSRASGYINNRPLGIMAGTARTVGRVRRSRHPAQSQVRYLTARRYQDRYSAFDK